jgi:integrase
VDYFDYYLEMRKAELGYRSNQKYKVIKGNVIKFQEITGKEVLVNDVGFKFAEVFKSVMLGQGYAPNTVERGVTFIKTVCKHANRHGLVLKNDFLDITTKNHKVTWPFLTFDELGKIEAHVFEKDYLQNAADWLVISCYTGQRISDFMRFTKDMIFEENHQQGPVQLIDITQDKTKAQVYIPILPPVQQILNKRGGEFPRAISDQKYNNYIKEVCKIVGINQVIPGTKRNSSTHKNENGEFEKFDLVSSHIGRRSFATNFYSSGSFDIRDIMEITGHTSERTFLLYIGKKKKSGARNFFNSYFKKIN